VAARRAQASGETVAGEMGNCEATDEVVVAGAVGVSKVGIGAGTAGGVDVGSAQPTGGFPLAFVPVLTRTTRLRHFEFGARTP